MKISDFMNRYGEIIDTKYLPRGTITTAFFAFSMGRTMVDSAY